LSGTADGNVAGQAVGVSINPDGGVSVSYSNGKTANVAQIAVATFTSEQGLALGAGGTFQQTDASGAPTVQAAGAGGAGTLQSSALESSNVDVTNELVNLVVLQRSFQANAKALQTEDQIIGTVVQLQTT
ncbi:MAG TPA: flagellar hook-basal body complex protein, partial [Xanthobacteraceae bacterium]|nr:flagellar hook-basal body complex protein [Xanthobacteraceae bacterium]